MTPCKLYSFHRYHVSTLIQTNSCAATSASQHWGGSKELEKAYWTDIKRIENTLEKRTSTFHCSVLSLLARSCSPC